jgi:diguanylate cyclase (GGDEF)-like protein
MAALAGAYAIVLLLKEPDFLWVSRWFVMMSSFIVAGLLVSHLTFRIRKLARNDHLTGLVNRRTFDEELERYVAQPQTDAQLCVMVLDLDNFKTINDTLGHQAGDRVLKEAAARWTEQLRPYDILARFGGDEFAVLLPRCPLDEAKGVAQRLRLSVPGGIGCSIGLARWDGVEKHEELLRRADDALYRAKQAGRGRIDVAVG